MLVESEKVELKKSTGELKQAIISIVAMLNKHQKGNLYFEVNDSGEAVGQQISNQTIRDVSKIISENIEPRIYPMVSKIIVNCKECIHVGFEGNDLPYFAYGRAYMRVGDEDRQLTQKEIKNIILIKFKTSNFILAKERVFCTILSR